MSGEQTKWVLTTQTLRQIWPAWTDFNVIQNKHWVNLFCLTKTCFHQTNLRKSTWPQLTQASWRAIVFCRFSQCMPSVDRARVAFSVSLTVWQNKGMCHEMLSFPRAIRSGIAAAKKNKQNGNTTVFGKSASKCTHAFVFCSGCFYFDSIIPVRRASELIFRISLSFAHRLHPSCRLACRQRSIVFCSSKTCHSKWLLMSCTTFFRSSEASGKFAGVQCRNNVRECPWHLFLFLDFSLHALCCTHFSASFFFARGVSPETRGTALVVYDNIYDAKNAVDHLSGFNVCGR